jgi:hypothetical protein
MAARQSLRLDWLTQADLGKRRALTMKSDRRF